MTTTIVVDGGGSAAPVPGLCNLRTTGAWACEGGTIRPGALYRSESPHDLEPGAASALRSLGIDLLLDLRSAEEVAAHGYAFDGLARTGHPVALLAPGQVHLAELRLEALYQQVLDEHGAALAAAVTSIARHDGGAVLVHCTAGKDRTGLVVALTLLALGVARGDVVADYASTHERLVGAWTDAFLAALPDGGADLPANLREILNGSPAEVLERTIDRLDERYGGAAAYLRRHGVADADLATLRTRLVDPTERS